MECIADSNDRNGCSKGEPVGRINAVESFDNELLVDDWFMDVGISEDNTR